MFAKDAIDINLMPLRLNQTVADAIEWCTTHNSLYAFVVDNAVLIGRFSEDFLYNYDNNSLLSTLIDFAEPITVSENKHAIELIAKAKQYNSFILPIVDESKNFLGLTSAESIINILFDNNILNEHQSIFVVEITANNYAMSDIAKIVESNHAQIYYSNYARKENNIAQITLILQAENYAAIANTFERFGYEVIYQSAENVYTDHLKERAESFIKYLEV
ncbi:MAG: hypothetical protein H6553_11050 [Chitinophagales bacterium]|nr:hypothetical protein [Chitinophagales bacterium]